MLIGTLDDLEAVRKQMRGSGFDPVVARVRGSEKAIGIVMVNEFRDSTFGPYNEVLFIAWAFPENSPVNVKAVDVVNAFSLQTPLDRGATTYVFKLWLNELSPIDGDSFVAVAKCQCYLHALLLRLQEDCSDGVAEDGGHRLRTALARIAPHQ